MGINLNLVLEVAQSTQGDFHNIKELVVNTDSRRFIENSLFVPIQGEKFDGHDYLQDAMNKGAVATIWKQGMPLPSELPEDYPVFFVDDTLEAFQSLANLYRKEVNPTVVAVTGSNGKTTTKDVVSSLLSEKYRVHKTEGNFNNHIGLPQTLFSMPKDCQVCVLEMGMNHFGEISLLSKIAQPNIALITNIGESHIENLGSREGITQAKLEITDGMDSEGMLVVDGDETLLTKAHDLAKVRGFEVLTCGYSDTCDWKISSVKTYPNGSIFSLKDQRYEVPLLGSHNVKNATLAIAVANALQLNQEQINEGFTQLEITGMRLETVEGKKGTLLINDAYNASPTSMIAAIETLKDLSGYSTKVVVLGDMYELGTDEQALHRKVATAVESPLTHMVTIGIKAQWIAEACKDNGWSNVDSFSDKNNALPFLESLLGKKTAILFKASRLAGLETLAWALQDRRNA